MDQKLRIIEAILFAAPAPVAPSVLQEQLGLVDASEIDALLAELQAHYDGRGVQLVQRDGAWSFQTAIDLATHLHFLSEKARRLSRAAIETLAIIAYHQPTTRGEIESIRGVAISKGTIDVLIEANWVKPGRRRETPGRPLTFVTTPHFLEHFGLESLKDLPGMDELKATGLLDARPAIHIVPDGSELEGQSIEDSENNNTDFSDDDFVADDETITADENAA